MLMETFMKETFIRDKSMGMGNIPTKIMIITKETGKKIKNMEKENSIMPIKRTFMKAILKITKKMVTENILLEMEMFMKENSRMETKKAREN